ncbi:hypothetical protein [Microbacterium sp.]|uniref:hypothetical protein n=1 Tax=Microbacterium sp. TaxID=51671 RepID=UPI003A866800
MSRVHRIDSMPDDAPWLGGVPPVGTTEHTRTIRALDRMLSIQRPVVIAHLRSIRLRRPTATTADIERMLERRYLAAVTSAGAAVGATAVIPGIGTSVTLALSGVETVGFLEATALYAQSLAELHGIRVDDPDRARALVLTMMLGSEGVALVSQLSRQASGKGPTRDKYWGELITTSLPRAAVGPLVDRLKSTFVRQFAGRGGASFLGKALPYGVGAAVGGVGNNILGRRVVAGSHRAFGPVPAEYPAELEPRPGASRLEHRAASGARRVGGALATAGQSVAGTVGKIIPRRAVRGDDADRVDDEPADPDTDDAA